ARRNIGRFEQKAVGRLVMRKFGFSSGSGAPVTTRRTFVEGLALGGVLVGAGALGAAFPARARGAGPGELAGNELDLRIGARPVNYTGRPAMATLVNGSLPAPTLRWREGETVTLRVRNEL